MNFVRQILCAILLLGLPGLALAGEIPGVPPPRLPSIEPIAELYNSNDNLGGGKDVDDFRTQQLGLSLVMAERWLFAFDHSILTFDKYADAQPDGRLDQISASLGYRLLRRRGENRQTNLDVGAGFRVQLAGNRQRSIQIVRTQALAKLEEALP